MEGDAKRDAGRGADAIGKAVADAVAKQSGGGAQQSIPEQIEALAKLRDQGHITPAEFETKKADLLAKM
jgi:Short C-terminal domain